MNLVAKALIAAVLGGATTLAQASAEPSSEMKGDAEAGKAKSAVCGACHGADGNSAAPNFPKLAGQVPSYTVKQLKDIKEGAREVPEMTAIAQGLSEQDMYDLAAYFADQTIKLGAADPKSVAIGQKVWRGGNAESGVTACAACHGAEGKGMPQAGFPALAGQHTQYIETQLKAFRAAGRGDHDAKYRTNDGENKMMQSTAARLSDDEISALSSYINGLY